MSAVKYQERYSGTGQKYFTVISCNCWGTQIHKYTHTHTHTHTHKHTQHQPHNQPTTHHIYTYTHTHTHSHTHTYTHTLTLTLTHTHTLFNYPQTRWERLVNLHWLCVCVC